MSYDKDVKVSLEQDKYYQNLNFTIPMEYFWNRLSDEDLLNIATQFMSGGYFTKILKDLVNEPASQYGLISSYTDINILEFKEVLIKMIDELKERYIEDVQHNEMRRWWSVGRSIEKIIKTVFPERNVRCTTNPHEEDFYIIDKDNNSDNVMKINILDLSATIENEKTNGRTGNDYFYDIKKKLDYIINEKERWYEAFKRKDSENKQLKMKVEELETKLRSC